MNYSIDVSERGTQSHLRVGIVLVSEYNELICSAFLGEECDKSCCSILLNKVLKLKISKAQSVYMTINTLSMDDSFDLISLLNKINIKVGSINSIFYFLHKAAEPFNCLEQDNLA